MTKQEWKVEVLTNAYGWSILDWSGGLCRLKHILDSDIVIVCPFGHVHRAAI